MTTEKKAAADIAPGDKIVRTLHHDGSPKRTVIVRSVQGGIARGAARYMFTVEPLGDTLGWYNETYQFTIER